MRRYICIIIVLKYQFICSKSIIKYHTNVNIDVKILSHLYIDNRVDKE